MTAEIRECLRVAAIVAVDDWHGKTVPRHMEARIDWLWSVVVDRLGDIRVHLDEVQPSLTSGALAERLQLRNSRALGELLSLRALPSYDRLRDLYYVVVITERFSAIQTVSKFASCHGARPADYYRLVERATGCRWSEVKRNGLIWTKAFALTHWGRWILSK